MSALFGVVELLDLRSALCAGEQGAELLAERFGCCARTIERHRKKLRASGVRVPVPSGVADPEIGGGGNSVKCERCGDRTATATVNQWRVCDRCEPKERVKLAAPVLPEHVEAMAPDASFRCEHFRCSLQARACIERQGATYEAGKNALDQSPRKVFRFAHCQDGTCAHGALIKLRVGDAYEAPDPGRKQRHILANVKAKARLLRIAPRGPGEEPTAEEQDDKPEAPPIADVTEAIEQTQGALAVDHEERPERGDFDAWLARKDAERPDPEPKKPRTHLSPDQVLAAQRARVAPAPEVQPPAAPEKEQQVMAAFSKIATVPDEQITEALKKHGSVDAAAKALGVSWGTLDSRLKKMKGGAPAAAKAKPAVVKSAEVVKEEPATPPPAVGGVRHRVELPNVEDLPFDYLLACIEYARHAQARLTATLAGQGGTISDLKDAA